ncbi:MAG: hypothetical protein V3R98_06120 [Alphaproteobacteria bacterium]
MAYAGPPRDVSIDEVMAEPIVRMLMESDGLRPAEVWAIINAQRSRLQRRPDPPER